MATRTKTESASKPRRAAKSDAQTPPWEREKPKAHEPVHLTPQAKATAKRRATKAGRPYPNLVDNMRAAASKK